MTAQGGAGEALGKTPKYDMLALKGRDCHDYQWRPYRANDWITASYPGLRRLRLAAPWAFIGPALQASNAKHGVDWRESIVWAARLMLESIPSTPSDRRRGCRAGRAITPARPKPGR